MTPEEQFEEAFQAALRKVTISELERRDIEAGINPHPAEPRHCSECFEGCPKCESGPTGPQKEDK